MRSGKIKTRELSDRKKQKGKEKKKKKKKVCIVVIARWGPRTRINTRSWMNTDH